MADDLTQIHTCNHDLFAAFKISMYICMLLFIIPITSQPSQPMYSDDFYHVTRQLDSSSVYFPYTLGKRVVVTSRSPTYL